MTPTAELIKAMEAGAVVVCDVAPYKNWEITYDPRHKRDPQPWAIAGTFRYSGHECRAISLAELRNRLEGR